MKKKLTLMAAMAACITVAHAQWQLTGNSISSSDFLGSTNAQPLQFRPVTYTLDVTGIEKFLHPETRKDYNGRIIETGDEAIKQKEQFVYTGFLAQEVEGIAKKLGYEFSGVDAAKNDKDLYSLRYAEFVVPLVKAVQELSKQNDELQRQVSELRLLMNNKDGRGIKGFLKQNIPNPSTGNTIIEYFVPETTRSAQVVLLDATGRTIKAFPIGNRGFGQLSISTAGFPSGAYVYSLIVDGEKADSRQLISTK